jgi:hypothetical protein
MATNDLVSIEVVQEFKSHGLWCHPGEVRKVDKSTADYFIQHGWAKLSGEAALPLDTSDKTLEVQNGKHSSGSTSPG